MTRALPLALRLSVLLVGAALFGILMPDFRYDVLSIIGIVLGRPLLAVALALWALGGAQAGTRIARYGAGMTALVVADLAGLARYVHDAGGTLWNDPLSASIFLWSFVAQIAIFFVAFYLAKLRTDHD